MDKEMYLYHCAHCGELFHAPKSRDHQVCCVYCGNSPVLARSKRSQTHGVEGKDVADFVAVRRKKRRKNLKLTYALWIGLLLLAAGGSYYYKEKQDAVVEQSPRNEEEVVKVSAAFQKLQATAFLESYRCLKGFDQCADVNERSSFVFAGLSKLVQMNDYYSGNHPLPMDKKWKLRAGYTGVKDGKISWVRICMIDDRKDEVELVFLPDDGTLKLDWEQFVRYSPSSWGSFHLQKKIGSEGDFRAYVRQRHRVAGEQGGGDLELLFYEPQMVIGARGQMSPQLTLAEDDPMAVRIRAMFNNRANKPADGVDGGRQFSSREEGLFRVRVRLGYEAAENGVPQLCLKKIYAFDWMDEKAPRGDNIKEILIREVN